MLSALEKAKERRRHDRRGQPAARDRADPLRQPAEGQGAHRGRHRARRRVPADPAQRRPRPVPGDRRAARGEGRRRPRLRRPPHHRLRDLARRTSRTSTGMPCCAPPACPAPRSSAWPSCSRRRGARSSAGRWASPSTATPSRRSRRSPTSRSLQGNIGKPGRRPVPGARPLQRAGRPDDGHLGEAAGPLRRAAAPGVRLRPAARARPRRRQHRPRHEGGEAQGARSAWAATSPRPPPTAR